MGIITFELDAYLRLHPQEPDPKAYKKGYDSGYHAGIRKHHTEGNDLPCNEPYKHTACAEAQSPTPTRKEQQ